MNGTPGKNSETHQDGAWTPRRTAVLYLAACVLLGAAYAVAFPGPFFYDDIPYIRDNPTVHVNALSWAQLKMAAFSSRPVTTFSLGLGWYVHGPTPGWFRLCNLLLHFATGYLFLLLCRRTLALVPRPPRDPRGLVPLSAALLWLFSPLAVQSVSYISQRSNVLCAFCSVLCLLAFVSGKRAVERRRAALGFAGAAVAGLLALGSKQNAVVLPVFVFLYDWIFFRRADLGVFRQRATEFFVLACLTVTLACIFVSIRPVGGRPFLLWIAVCPALFFLYKLLEPAFAANRTLKVAAPRLFIALAVFGLTVLVARATDPLDSLLFRYKDLSFHPVTPWERILTESRVVFLYITEMVFPAPWRLSLIHDVTVSKGLFSPPATFCAALFHLAAIFAALGAARRFPLFSFSVLWFYGNLAVESTFLPLDLMFEHRTYIPSLFPMLLLSLALWRLLRSEKAFSAVLLSLLFLLGLGAFARNRVFSDDIRLWQDSIRKAPRSSAGYNNLGVAWLSRNDPVKAEQYFIQAGRLDRYDMNAFYNLGLLYKGLGRVSDAEKAFQKALFIRRDYVFAENELGNLFFAQGLLDEAEKHYRAAIAISPQYAAAWSNLGNIMVERGDLEGALAQFQKAASLLPNDVNALTNAGMALTRQGKFAMAQDLLKSAVAIAPGSAAARLAYGNALLGTGDVSAAIKQFFQALRLSPRDHTIRNSLAVAFSTQGMIDEALDQYQKALGDLDQDADTYRDSARALAAGGLIPDARRVWARAYAINRDKAAVYKNIGLVLAGRGDSARALENLSAAQSLVPDDPEVATAMGVLYSAAGDLGKAADQFETAVSLSTRDAQAHRNLGLTLARMGLYEPALDQLGRAADLAPADESLTHDIAVVKKMRDRAGEPPAPGGAP
ncbi:MAG: tetratricopeptide repeat protein [Thermodesulfobacteriota bacterium]